MRTKRGNNSVNTFLWQPAHMTAATDTHATIEELLEAVYTFGSMQRVYNEI
jgi:hypothetical protein